MGWGAQSKGRKEVVEVVLQGCWDVMRDDPIKPFSKEIEDIRGRLQAKSEDDIVEELALPGVTEEVPIFRADWYVAEGIFEIELGQKRPTAEGPQS